MAKCIEHFDIPIPIDKLGIVVPAVGITFTYSPETKEAVKSAINKVRIYNSQLPKRCVGGWLVELKIWWCHKELWDLVKNVLLHEGYVVSDLVTTPGLVDDLYNTRYGVMPDTVAEEYDKVKDNPKDMLSLYDSMMAYIKPIVVDTSALSAEVVAALARLGVGLPISEADLELGYKAASAALDKAYDTCLKLMALKGNEIDMPDDSEYDDGMQF